MCLLFVLCLLLVLMYRKQCKIEKELQSLNEKAEGLMKKNKGTKREIQMAAKVTQTSGNADGQVGINRFHPQFSSTPITYQRPSINATRKINNNTRRRRSGIPRSTTFPQSAQLEVEEFQSEFSIPIPFDTDNV